MGKYEKEVKILNINKESIEKKLLQLGAHKKEECIQQIYVYDLPSIYARYYDCILQLKKISREYEFEVCRSKLKIILNEVDNLITSEESEILKQEGIESSLCDLLKNTNSKDLLETFSNKSIVNIIKKYEINPNKWVRLRRTNDKTTVTIKHILNPNSQGSDKLQKVIETEMEVPSIEIGNDILEQLGFSFRNYQEKYRVTYNLEKVEVDIDSWPLIPSYIEIENDSEEVIESVIQKLGLGEKEIVSCNTADVYKKYGIDLYQFRELRFSHKEYAERED